MTTGPVYVSAEPNREVHLGEASGMPLTSEHFRVITTAVPRPGVGEVLVRNKLMAVTAAMCTMMVAEELPMPSYRRGSPLWGAAIGEVVAAGPASGIEPGCLVKHELGWRDYALLDATEVEPVELTDSHDPGALLSHGAPAWAALHRVAGVGTDDTVFVSGAAGGIGTLAGQIARHLGAKRVVGSTGSTEKADYLRRELGYDELVLRNEASVTNQLRMAAPEGLDVVCDTVGGEQLEAAVENANTGARVALLGALSGQLGGDGLSAPTRLDSALLIRRRMEIRGVSLRDHADAVREWGRLFVAGLAEGSFSFPHTRLYGLERAPEALRELVAGKHLGTVLVEL
ncbi:MDR family NADP-dependent oxidoreductase [Actinopolyspora sp. H202]|uniref:MDR family NADP-dependent oxidoreductase n=1 Tax=Actinopolyspora sp. H202 TaxID=1500456 RepID=UPI003EE6B009